VASIRAGARARMRASIPRTATLVAVAVDGYENRTAVRLRIRIRR
jgi:hypothetical protein